MCSIKYISCVAHYIPMTYFIFDEVLTVCLCSSPKVSDDFYALNSLSGKLLTSFSLELFNMKILSCSFFFFRICSSVLSFCLLAILCLSEFRGTAVTSVGLEGLSFCRCVCSQTARKRCHWREGQGFSALPRSWCVGRMGEEAVWKWTGCSWSLAGPVCPGDEGRSPWPGSRSCAGRVCAAWPCRADSSAGRFAVGCSVLQVGASQFTCEP